MQLARTHHYLNDLTLVAPVFARPGAWRVFDVAVAVVMTAIAAKLLLGILI